ncbi:hypothetical protein ACQKWADRAFT_280285 [Trichoderma austrokoningii]
MRHSLTHAQLWLQHLILFSYTAAEDGCCGEYYWMAQLHKALWLQCNRELYLVFKPHGRQNG